MVTEWQVAGGRPRRGVVGRRPSETAKLAIDFIVVVLADQGNNEAVIPDAIDDPVLAHAGARKRSP